MRVIKNNLTPAGTFLVGVVGHHYVSKIWDYKTELAAPKDAELRGVA